MSELLHNSQGIQARYATCGGWVGMWLLELDSGKWPGFGLVSKGEQRGCFEGSKCPA